MTGKANTLKGNMKIGEQFFFDLLYIASYIYLSQMFSFELRESL